FSRDWSSDVCSSDLTPPCAMRKPSSQRLHHALAEAPRQSGKPAAFPIEGVTRVAPENLIAAVPGKYHLDDFAGQLRDHISRNREIGRASCRERGEM